MACSQCLTRTGVESRTPPFGNKFHQFVYVTLTHAPQNSHTPPYTHTHTHTHTHAHTHSHTHTFMHSQTTMQSSLRVSWWLALQHDDAPLCSAALHGLIHSISSWATRSSCCPGTNVNPRNWSCGIWETRVGTKWMCRWRRAYNINHEYTWGINTHIRARIRTHTYPTDYQLSLTHNPDFNTCHTPTLTVAMLLGSVGVISMGSPVNSPAKFAPASFFELLGCRGGFILRPRQACVHVTAAEGRGQQSEKEKNEEIGRQTDCWRV